MAAGPSDFGVHVDEPAIFLSYSVRHLAFVEHLYNALQSANHEAFFDTHTLPTGSPFSPHIIRAARGCKLGVVVLSEEFLQSKWTMIELKTLVLERGLNASVLPLFYRLHPADLKYPENLSRWRSIWKERAGEDAEQWEEAVRTLGSFIGEVFNEGTSETEYIEKVVQRICKLVPCHVPYDVSSIQGHQRLAEEIAGMFEEVKAKRSEERACIVGLHGIGGSGKTTLCKCMVNLYTSQYLGRSCLVEFPFDGDKSKIAQECKRALKKLTILNNEQVLKEADSFDQIIHLMKEHMKAKDVFLAIDNVWESCQEEAKRLLRVGFTAKSKILMMSRSEQVLKDVLNGHTTASCKIESLPALVHEEAFQIFQNNFGLADLRCLLDRNQVDSVLERCRFNGIYHSLALKALAQHVQRALGDSENIEHRLSVVLEGIGNFDLRSVDELIKLNYEKLSPLKKHMFLDIVVLTIMQDRAGVSFNKDPGFYSIKYAEAHRLLCVLYKEVHETNFNGLIRELASDGVIQIGEDEYGEKAIGVHDLYMDLVLREAKKSPRFFFMGKATTSMEEMEWEKLDRVFLCGGGDASVFETLQRQKCRNLRVLHVALVEMRGRINLSSMPSLSVLVLAKVWTYKKRSAPVRALELNGLVQLQILQVLECKFMERIRGLDTLQNLQTLHIQGCARLDNLDGLNGLIRLEALHVGSCESLTKMPDLRGLAGLKTLRLRENIAMQEVGCLSSALECVHVEHCWRLKRLPDVSTLTGLESLKLWVNEAMEEVGGEYLSSTLKHLSIGWCEHLRRFPSLKHCISLQTITAKQVTGVISIGADLGKLANLQKLTLAHMEWSSSLLNEQWKHLTLLQHLSIERCGSIETLELGCLVSLKYLCVEGCEALEEMGDLSALPCLQRLNVWGCPRLKKMGSLGGTLTHLKSLKLEECGSLEASTIPDVSSLRNVKYAKVSGCGNLKDWN